MSGSDETASSASTDLAISLGAVVAGDTQGGNQGAAGATATAGTTASSETDVVGGIDLHSSWLDWNVENESDDLDATFDFSEQINIPIDGFIPVIVNVTTIPHLMVLINQ